ncbi:MAG TPA: glycosyltransferase family 4 protein [Rhizobiaceae bacterium]|nr:glycosyltransferase family 4 protein [Rhizobiaceae bacterium]
MKRSLIVALRRLAQLISAILDTMRVLLLAPFIAVGLLIYPQVLKKDFYRSAPGAGWFRRRFPTLEFVFKGAWALRDPHPAFSQEAMIRDFPRLRLRPPVLNHVLNPLAERDMPLLTFRPALAPQLAPPQMPMPPQQIDQVQQPAPPIVIPASVPAAVPVTAFDDIWDRFEADGVELSREVSSLTPTRHVRQSLGTRVLANAVAHSEEMDVVLRLMNRFPDRVDHLLLVPWLGIKGGAERLSERFLAYLRARYPADRLCIFAPDAIHSYSEGTESRYGVSIVAINDEMPNADQATRLRILDRILVNLRPACVHNTGSLTGWLAFRDHAAQYSCDMRLFVNLFSDIRIDDNAPIGYYHNYLPYIIEHIAGVLCDNRSIMLRAIADFGLTKELAAKFHHVPTPLLGLNGGDPRLNLHPYTPKRRGRSLWMSRIAVEKRIDILNSIARALPDRQISVYGATLAVSAKVDMTLLDLPNIDVKGEFERLSRLPLKDFDSYIFTSNNEGMPISVLEATMHGLPVVAPDVGGIGEIIDSTTGWLVSSPDAVAEYVDALKEIEENPREAARRVARAQERLVELHSMKTFIRALESVPGYVQAERQ